MSLYQLQRRGGSLFYQEDFRVNILVEGYRAIALKLCLNSGSTDFLLGCVFVGLGQECAGARFHKLASPLGTSLPR